MEQLERYRKVQKYRGYTLKVFPLGNGWMEWRARKIGGYPQFLYDPTSAHHSVKHCQFWAGYAKNEVDDVHEATAEDKACLVRKYFHRPNMPLLVKGMDRFTKQPLFYVQRMQKKPKSRSFYFRASRDVYYQRMGWTEVGVIIDPT